MTNTETVLRRWFTRRSTTIFYRQINLSIIFRFTKGIEVFAVTKCPFVCDVNKGVQHISESHPLSSRLVNSQRLYCIQKYLPDSPLKLSGYYASHPIWHQKLLITKRMFYGFQRLLTINKHYFPKQNSRVSWQLSVLFMSRKIWWLVIIFTWRIASAV